MHEKCFFICNNRPRHSACRILQICRTMGVSVCSLKPINTSPYFMKYCLFSCNTRLEKCVESYKSRHCLLLQWNYIWYGYVCVHVTYVYDNVNKFSEKTLRIHRFNFTVKQIRISNCIVCSNVCINVGHTSKFPRFIVGYNYSWQLPETLYYYKTSDF